jgi:hypothetical protein
MFPEGFMLCCGCGRWLDGIELRRLAGDEAENDHEES